MGIICHKEYFFRFSFLFLSQVFVNLISKSNCNSLLNERYMIPDEELLFDICDLVSTSRCGSSVCNDLALSSMSRIQAQSAHYPVHILVSCPFLIT